MKELMIKPTIYQYENVNDFVEEFQIGSGDLVISNEYIFNPYFGQLNLDCDVIFQEKYGLGEPTDIMAEAIWKEIKKPYKRIIAIGGGTVIDISKLFALKEISPVLKLYDGEITPIKEKELVLVPTTCGTGSEVTNISILALTARGTKKGFTADEIYADSAVLVPELMNGLPFGVFAASSIDALIHAVESSLSPKGNETTRMFGYKAIEMILKGYMEIAKKGPDARNSLLRQFLLASNYAGIAFGNAGCAAVHALSYPLGAAYHVAHGEANYAIFTGVMKNYLEMKTTGEITVLNEFFAEILGCESKIVYEEIDKLLGHLLQKKPLREYGMTEKEIEEFADSVLENQQRLLANNFVPFDRNRIIKIYRELY